MVCDLRFAVADLGHRPHFILVLPTLLQDIIDSADKWGDGEAGRIDPFTEIHTVSRGNLHQGIVSNFLPACFRHDRPYDHM